MRRLIHEAPPAGPLMWLGDAPFVIEAPACGALALHLARAAPSAVLCVAGRRIPAGPSAGWLLVEAPPAGLVTLRAEAAPLPLSLDARARPALRVWQGVGDAIPEAHWRGARVLGQGGLAVLGAGQARPMLRLSAGGAGWITLPPLNLPALPSPRLVVLRGQPPCHELHWGDPGAALAQGPAQLTLAVRAGLACEVLWRA